MESPCALQCAFFIVHFLGLAMACVVRVVAGRRGAAAAETAFLACLALVGVCALAGPQFAGSLWRFSSATLALMLVGAVVDLRAARS